MLVLFVVASFCCVASSRAILNISRPNILFVVVDDLGFDDVGFRSHEINTPTIDRFAACGAVLQQYYVHSVCSPSRATFLTGRYSMHHSIVDWIPPAQAFGLPLNETTLAQKMKQAGMATAAVGKWHLGFYKWANTPTFRGFDSFVGFYGGGEMYFDHTSGGAYDMRRDSVPMCGANCSKVKAPTLFPFARKCDTSGHYEEILDMYSDISICVEKCNTQQVLSSAKGVYSTTLFTTEAVRVVQSHNTTAPLFLYLAYQGVHSPSEVPQSYVDPYNTSISDLKRRRFAGMLSAVDEGLHNVTRALESRGMEYLLVFTSDNGGPTTTSDGVGGRNWPLRGGKHAVWEGGTRATSFISGSAGVVAGWGGTAYNGLMHGADWLPTLATVAGVDPTGSLPLDGVSQWEAVTGTSHPPRREIVYGNSTNNCSWKKGDPRRVRYEGSKEEVGCGFAIASEDERGRLWKLIQGYGGGPDTWCNSTSHAPSCRTDPPPSSVCPSGWCLYDVVDDPEELNEVSSENPDVLVRLQKEMGHVLESYTQYELDKDCPPQTFADDPVVGKVWQPWC